MIRIRRMMKAGASVAMLLLMMSCASAAWLTQHEHSFQQDVEGTGFATVRQNVNEGNLALLNYMHGSGTINSATLISSNESWNNYCQYGRENYTYTGAVDAYRTNISFLEQNEMVYSPMAMAYGTGFYAKNPIVYNSKLKEKTWGKNYQPEMGVSMHHQIEYASAFKKDVGIDLQCKDKVELAPSTENGYGLAQMRIEEEVTEGVVHIGELVAGSGDGCKGDCGWKDPQIEIDENYVGTFRIQKNMEYCATKYPKKFRPDWLSCCIGGYDSIDAEDKLFDEEKVFTCEC